MNIIPIDREFDALEWTPATIDDLLGFTVVGTETIDEGYGITDIFVYGNSTALMVSVNEDGGCLTISKAKLVEVG